MRKLIFVVAAVAIVVPTTAAAQSEAPPASVEVDYTIDGTIVGLSLAGAYLFSLLPVDTEKSWEKELFGIDERVRGRFSKRAAKVSDATLVLTVVSPLLEQLGRDVDERAGARGMIYGQTFALNLLATAAVKYTARRPRPYTYSGDETVQAYAKSAGKDSHVSLFSGHASIAFSSAIAGSYLYSADAKSRAGSASAWFVNVTLATTTAGLRVRAGKHFYSDVVIGALVGSAIGFAVPALHSGEEGVYVPSALELGAAAGGLVLGTAIAKLIPLETKSGIALSPALIDGGTGLSISGRLR